MFIFGAHTCLKQKAFKSVSRALKTRVTQNRVICRLRSWKRMHEILQKASLFCFLFFCPIHTIQPHTGHHFIEVACIWKELHFKILEFLSDFLLLLRCLWKRRQVVLEQRDLCFLPLLAINQVRTKVNRPPQGYATPPLTCPYWCSTTHWHVPSKK